MEQLDSCGVLLGEQIYTTMSDSYPAQPAKAGHERTRDQQLPLTPVFTKKKWKCIHTEIYIPIFIAAVFIIVKIWKQSEVYQ